MFRFLACMIGSFQLAQRSSYRYVPGRKESEKMIRAAVVSFLLAVVWQLYNKLPLTSA